MKKILIILLFATCSQQCWAEIRNYILDKIEIADGTGAVKTEPIIAMNPKKPYKNEVVQPTGEKKVYGLIIAGLGTNRVTAQGPGLGLCRETQIFPMDKAAFQIEGRTDKAEWYYAVHDQGVTVIELKEKDIKLHNLGLVPYTFVGTLNK